MSSSTSDSDDSEYVELSTENESENENENENDDNNDHYEEEEEEEEEEEATTRQHRKKGGDKWEEDPNDENDHQEYCSSSPPVSLQVEEASAVSYGSNGKLCLRHRSRTSTDSSLPSQKQTSSSSSPSLSTTSSVRGAAAAAVVVNKSRKRQALYPTEGRRTVAGGYAHTTESKRNISRANKGGTPWNKGTPRSALDKAKIAVGVRARNLWVAQHVRRSYHLTELEHADLARQIKRYRERVRLARVENDRRASAIRTHRLELEQLDRELRCSSSGRKGGSHHAIASGNNHNNHTNGCTTTEPAASANGGDKTASSENEMDAATPTLPVRAAFVHPVDYTWTPHILDDDDDPPPPPPPPFSGEDDNEFDDSDDNNTKEMSQRTECYNPNHQESESKKNSTSNSNHHPKYATLCPMGGPGGLICCAHCSALYSDYMIQTFTELERQSIAHKKQQVEDLIALTDHATSQLEKSCRTARQHPPPLLKNRIPRK